MAVTGAHLHAGRILMSLALGALVLSVGFAVSVWVGVESPLALPTEFGVAEPRIGDRALYTLSVLHWSADGGFSVPLDEARFSEFGWTGVGRMRDDNGVLHETATLWHSKPLGGGDGVPLQLNSTFHFDLETRDPVAWSFDSAVSNALEASSIIGGPTSVLSQYDMRWRVFFDPEEPTLSNLVLDCGIRNALQGMRLDVRQGVALFPGCTMISLGSPVVVFPVLVQPTDVFHPVGWDNVAGRPALVFEGATRFGRVAVWLAEDVPYPLQISVQRSDDQERFSVFRLAEYARGRGEMRPGDPPSADAAPDHEWKPRTATGPSEVGVEHPFPLSDAYTHAMQDPEAPDLRRFVQAHPDAYMAAAAYAELRQDNSVHRRWDFALTDGIEWFPVGLTRTDEPPAGLSFIPVEPTQSTWRYDNASAARNLTMETDGSPRTPLPPSRAPPTMPTVASQMERWRAYAGGDYEVHAPNWWSFQIRCKGNGCSASELVVAAGYQSASLAIGLQGIIDGPSSIDQDLSAMSVTYPIDGSSGTVVSQPDRISYLLEFTDDERGAGPVAAADPVPGTARARPANDETGAIVPQAAVQLWASLFAVGAAGAAWVIMGARFARDSMAQEITATVARWPGSTVDEVAARTGHRRSAVAVRAAALARSGRIVEVRRGRQTVLRPADINLR